jgi:hypothetical protein
MYFLTYVSKAEKIFTKGERDVLLEKAQVKNSASKVTGLLMYRSQLFFQLLEGDSKDVLETFERISMDGRHSEIKVLFEGEVPNAVRIFPNWHMGLIDGPLTDKKQETLSQTLHEIAASEKPERERILELLKRFANTLPNPQKKA